MTIDRWIALGACIAAFISAIAAFFVVVLSGIQRKLAYKPQLMFKPLPFKYQLNNKKADIFNKIIFLDSDNTVPDKTNLVANIGLGTAIDVSVNWSYDPELIVKKLNSALDEDGRGITLSVYKNAIALDVPTNTPFRYDTSRIKMDDKIDYILPYNQDKNQVSILIPHAYFSIICALLIYSLKSTTRMDKSASIIGLHVKYYDIGGVPYNQIYDVKTNFHYSRSDEEYTTMYGQITFTKKHLRKTIAGLAKIRKSYVNFMNEHDFNKNI